MDKTYLQKYVIDGGILMIALIPCAFLAVAYIIQSFVNLRKNRIAPKLFLKEIEKVDSNNAATNFNKIISEDDSPLAIIYTQWTEKKRGLTKLESENLLKDITDYEISKLYHENNQLLTIYQVAPLLGLLGTVLGMMKSFYEFSITKEKSLEILSKGINEALVTTIWGLFIAIPAFIALHFIKKKLFKYEVAILPDLVMRIFSRLNKYLSDSNTEDVDKKELKSHIASSRKFIEEDESLNEENRMGI